MSRKTHGTEACSLKALKEAVELLAIYSPPPSQISRCSKGQSAFVQQTEYFCGEDTWGTRMILIAFEVSCERWKIPAGKHRRLAKFGLRVKAFDASCT